LIAVNKKTERADPPLDKAAGRFFYPFFPAGAMPRAGGNRRKNRANPARKRQKNFFAQTL